MSLRSPNLLSANAALLSEFSQPVLTLKSASKDVVEDANHRYPAFRKLSLSIFPGEKLAFFAVNASEARSLISCLSGVETLDGGVLDQNASVSWPLGSNESFSNKLSGYMNAKFAAEVYGAPSRIREDLNLIQDLAGVSDEIFHKPLSSWPGHSKDALKLAVSLAFEFDVVTIGRISGWDYRSVHPRAVRMRCLFEERIKGRTLVMCGNGQGQMALDYCEEGLALVGGSLVYRGDPEVCLELVKEESKKQKQKRRSRVKARIASLLEEGQEDLEDNSEEPTAFDDAIR